MNSKTLLGGSLAGILLTTTALAETSATATTKLNMRAGPSPMHEVISVMPAGTSVVVDGCLNSSNWCHLIPPSASSDSISFFD